MAAFKIGGGFVLSVRLHVRSSDKDLIRFDEVMSPQDLLTPFKRKENKICVFVIIATCVEHFYKCI